MLISKDFEIQNLTVSSKIPFGIEIEFENALLQNVKQKLAQCKLQKWVTSKEIGVTRQNIWGGELSSPLLYNYKKYLIQIQKSLQILKEEKAHISQSTSLQVSVDRGILEDNALYLYRFLLLWILYEPDIYHFCYGETDHPRKSLSIRAMPCGNHIMKILSENGIDIDTCTQIPFSTLFSALENRLKGKFFGILFETQNNFQIETNRIELRIPNGTLQQSIILNTIQFFITLLNASKNEQIPWHALEETKRQKQKEMEELVYKPYYGAYQSQILQKAAQPYQGDSFADLIYPEETTKKQFLKQYYKTF